jgi:hypothetical protein
MAGTGYCWAMTMAARCPNSPKRKRTSEFGYSSLHYQTVKVGDNPWTFKAEFLEVASGRSNILILRAFWVKPR